MKPNSNHLKRRWGGVYETQHKLVIGHWSLVISHWKTKDKGQRTKDEGQKRRLGGGDETQQLKGRLGGGDETQQQSFKT